MPAYAICFTVATLIVFASAFFVRRGPGIALAGAALLALATYSGETGPPPANLSPLAMVLLVTTYAGLLSQSSFAPHFCLRILRASRGDPFRLLVLVSIGILVISALVGHVVAFTAAVTLTLLASKRLGLDIAPFLVVEITVAALGGSLTLTASAPTALIAEYAGLSYIDVALAGGTLALAGTAMTLALAKIAFYRVLSPLSPAAAEIALRRVQRYDADVAKLGAGDLRPVWAVWALTLAAIAFCGSVPGTPPPATAAILGAAIALALRPRLCLEYADSATLIYLVAMTWVLALCEAGGLGEIMRGLVFTSPVSSPSSMPLVILIGSSLMTSLFGAHQAALLGSWITSGIGDYPLAETATQCWWSLLFGCTLGGALPPVGGGATLAALSLIRREGLRIRVVRLASELLVFWLVLLVLAGCFTLAIGVGGRWVLVLAGGVCWMGFAVAIGWCWAQLRRMQ